MKRRNFLALLPVLASVPLLSRLISTPAAQSSLTDGLVAHWPFDGTAVKVISSGPVPRWRAHEPNVLHDSGGERV